MISAINWFSPKALVMAIMLSASAISAGSSIKAQQQQSQYRMSGDTINLQIYEQNAQENLKKLNNINDVKKHFGSYMNECMFEDAWKGKTKGMNLIEYIKLESFVNAALSHKDEKVRDWAKNKLEEMEYLKSSEYNKRTLCKDLLISSSKVVKYEKQLDKIMHNYTSPPDFIEYMLYGEDYKKINDHNYMLQKYCERDIAYYKNLYKAELNNILSSKSVKKLKAGQGKKVK